MLLSLLGGYLTASAPPIPTLTATATRRACVLPVLRPSPRLVAGRSAGETVHATATEEEEQEWKELQDEGLPRGGQQDDHDHDPDPEIADIMGDYFDHPKKAQSRMEVRIKKKMHKVLQAKTGSPNPMKVIFNKFDFSNSYIWFEFYNALLPKDVKLICDTLRSWHIVGRLGGCNSMNMQLIHSVHFHYPMVFAEMAHIKLSQLSLDCKRPTYDALEAANATPTSFYNIGDLEIQENLARVWVDIGIQDPLLLDILLNSLTTINSDHLGIKRVQFGGSEFQSWNDSLNTEEVGYNAHKI